MPRLKWKLDDPDHPLRSVIDRLKAEHNIELDKVSALAAELDTMGVLRVTLTMYLAPLSTEEASR